MASYYGKKLVINLFGESHGPAVGITMDGLPTGFEIDEVELRNFMDRRASGNSDLTTQRKEADLPEFISGIFQGKTCGTPLTILIRNGDAKSEDYGELHDVPRPGHADYTNHIRLSGDEDYRSGGHSSARLTAALTAGGGIAKQMLEDWGITVDAKLIEVDGNSENFDEIIAAAKEEGDSVGGIIECTIKGVPAGFGDPIFDGIENRFSQMIFAIPAVKGIEFGDARMKGSESNDAFDFDEEGKVITLTNHQGGILGGIANGMDIVFRVAFKPTPSISKTQQSISYSKGEVVELQVKGRHDPCVALRGVPVVEAAAAITMLDFLL